MLLLINKKNNRIIGYCEIGGMECSEDSYIIEMDDVDTTDILCKAYENGELVFKQEFKDEDNFQMKKSQAIEGGNKMLRELTQRSILDSVNDEMAYTMRYLYDQWEPKVEYKQDKRLMYNDKFYKVNQTHTSSNEWLPSENKALYSKIPDPSIEYPEWREPKGAHDAYSYGAKVTYENQKYISQIDGNTTVPGTDERYWKLVLLV